MGGDGRNTGCPQAFSDPKSRDLDKTFPEPSKFLIQKNKHMQEELVNFLRLRSISCNNLSSSQIDGASNNSPFYRKTIIMSKMDRNFQV